MYCLWFYTACYIDWIMIKEIVRLLGLILMIIAGTWFDELQEVSVVIGVLCGFGMGYYTWGK